MLIPEKIHLKIDFEGFTFYFYLHQDEYQVAWDDV